MNYFDFVVLVFFLGNIGILLLKIYNVMKYGQFLEKSHIVITLIFSILSFIIMGLNLNATDVVSDIWRAAYLFNINSLVVLLNVILTLIEFALYFTKFWGPQRRRNTTFR